MKQGQKTIIKKLITNNSGQAVVEYVLLAIIVVSLIIGMGKVFTALDDGFNQYMGGYIACLMEYGELPSLGVQAAELKKHTGNTGKKCDAQFAAFSFEEGRPPTGGGGGSSGSNGSNSNQASGNGRNGSNSDRNGDGSGNGNGSGSGVGDGSGNGDGDNDTASGLAGGRGGRGGGRGGADRNRGASSQGGYATADTPVEFENSKTRVIEDDEDDENSARNKGRRKRNLTNNSGYEPYRAITGRMKQELEKQQKRRSTPRQPTRTVTTLTKEEARFIPVRKSISRAVAAEANEMKDSGGNFTFGNIIRWLLIAAMILAIIIFFGGQVLNYSNSKD